jgi:hypothetical protein
MNRGHSHSFEPRSFSEAVEFSAHIAGTSFVPSHFKGKPEEILAAIQYGAEVGLGPMAALNGLAVIQGKVTMYASTMRALVEASGLMEKCSVTYTDSPPCSTVVVRRTGREDATFSFSYDDAMRANLATRDMYKKYPERMYTARAISFALRDEFADVLRGILAAEEMDDTGVVVNEDEDFSSINGTKSEDEPRGLMVGEMVMAGYDPVLAERALRGFAKLGWSKARQIVAIKEFGGDAEGLVAYLLSKAGYTCPVDSEQDSHVVPEVTETGEPDGD